MVENLVAREGGALLYVTFKAGCMNLL